MAERKIKFAVVGQGHIGKRHAEMIRRNDACELVAVCDIASEQDCGVFGIKEKFYYLSHQKLYQKW